MIKQVIFIFLFFAIKVLLAQDLLAFQKIPDISSKISETNTSNTKRMNDSLKLAVSIYAMEGLSAKLNSISEKTNIGETDLISENIWSHDNITPTATRAKNDASLAQLKETFEFGQVEINRLKTEIENTTISQKNILNTISSKNTASVAKTDVLLAQLKMKSDNNQSEINRLKAELEKATLDAENKLTIVNSKNTSSNAEVEVLVAQLKTKSESDLIEINRLKAGLAKIKNATVNTSNISRSPDVKAHISESDYFLDDKGKSVENEFYVVLGTFSNRENADRFKATNFMKGHVNAQIIQNQITKVYNIYGIKTNNKADAEAEQLKFKAEYPDVWILKLE